MTSVAKLELESITDFQKEIHLTKEKEAISSIFYHEFRKSTWYTHIHARLKCTADDENLEFVANTTFHYLKYTYMVTELPEIRIKPQYEGQYRICWTHNIGSNIVESADFQVDDDYFTGFDRQWMDIQSQFYMKPGFREHYNMCMGNLNFLEEWSNHLPRYKTTVPQPWYYSIDTGYAFPLYYCNSESTVVHNYQMRTKIADLLRMAVYKEDLKAWVELPAVDFTVLEGASALTKLKTPELWGCYAYITEDEIDFHKCKTERIFYINDVIACDASNPTTYGLAAEINLYCETPCKAMFWMAENLDATKLRNYSNYTTDTNNIYRGWNPVDRVTLKYGKTDRIKNMGSEHFERVQAWYHMPSAPSEPGYNTYSFAQDSMSLDAEIGLVFTRLRTKLILHIKNTDPFNRTRSKASAIEDYSEYEDGVESVDRMSEDGTDRNLVQPEFLARVRLLVLKKLTITKSGDSRFEFTI
jgi:hypothetical protein